MSKHHLPPRWIQRLSSGLPSRDALARIPLLGGLAHRLGEPALWRVRPEGLARGAAVGVFWAFAVPVAQFAIAAVHCIWWRGHLPVALGATLITNPLTIGPWLLLAHELGAAIVGPAAVPEVEAGGRWLDQLQALGWPTLVGMASFAVGGALLAYLLVRIGAQARLLWKLRRRRLRHAA